MSANTQKSQTFSVKNYTTNPILVQLLGQELHISQFSKNHTEYAFSYGVLGSMAQIVLQLNFTNKLQHACIRFSKYNYHNLQKIPFFKSVLAAEASHVIVALEFEETNTQFVFERPFACTSAVFVASYTMDHALQVGHYSQFQHTLPIELQIFHDRVMGEEQVVCCATLAKTMAALQNANQVGAELLTKWFAAASDIHIASITGHFVFVPCFKSRYSIKLKKPLVLQQQGNQIRITGYHSKQDRFDAILKLKNLPAIKCQMTNVSQVVVTEQDVPFYVLRKFFPSLPFQDMGTIHQTQMIHVKSGIFNLNHLFVVKSFRETLTLVFANHNISASPRAIATIPATMTVDVDQSYKLRITYLITQQGKEPFEMVRKYFPTDSPHLRWQIRCPKLDHVFVQQFFGVSVPSLPGPVTIIDFSIWKPEHVRATLYMTNKLPKELEICYFVNTAHFLKPQRESLAITNEPAWCTVLYRLYKHCKQHCLTDIAWQCKK